MPDTQYFLTDLDGTLLRSDATVSDFSIEVFNKILSQNHVASFATARSFVSAKPLVRGIRWKHPIIVYNGAIIMDPQAERIIQGQFIQPETAWNILRLGHEFGFTPLVFGLAPDGSERVWHEDLKENGLRHFAESRRGDPRFRLRAPLVVEPEDRVMIITYIGREEDLLPFKDQLAEELGKNAHVHFMRDNYLKEYFFLEVSHPNANKASAMKAWAALVNCQPDEITVFGDNLNDIGLFAGAGYRLAVKNGHETLKSRADKIIGSNDDDGVAKYIASMIVGWRPQGR